MYSAPDPLTRLYRPTWAVIDLDAFARNLLSITKGLPAHSRLIAVLKADAYGHGSVELARRCEKESVPMLAVALLEEALELQDAGIGTPIIILGPLSEGQVELAARNELLLGIAGPELLETVCAVSARLGKRIRIHLKLDSGMNRMGLVATDLSVVANLLRANEQVQVEAIYTHFANASDPDNGMTTSQQHRFRDMIGELRGLGVTAPLHHSANSAATVRGLVQPGDLVRVGIALYGGRPLEKDEARLEPVMTWRTQVVRLKSVPAGETVGYGATFKTTRTTRIATLPVGYADGYDRLLSNRAEILLRGRRVPVVGRVSMDLTTVDVTDFPEVSLGDEAILLGEQGSERITAEELAEKTGTISYEVFCNVSGRVPRLYRQG